MVHLQRPTRRSASLGLGLLVAAAALSACSALPGGMTAGTPIDKARHGLFPPTEEFALPNGGTRLEFPQGDQTFMLDFDRNGLLVTSQQVLTLPNLGDAAVGMPADQVRLRYGRPVTVFGTARPREHVWNYRFAQADCVWYQISISDATQLVTAAGLGQDPRCDGPSKGSR